MRVPYTTKLCYLSCMIAVVLSIAQPSSAHFMWVESNGPASPGEEHAIAVYFGEYQESLREEAGGRLDSLDGVTLDVIDPKRARHEIKLTKKDNHFIGQLPSCLPGRYGVTARQAEAPVQDLTKHDIGIVKPMFYARTEFVCYAEGRVGERQPEPSPTMDLEAILLSHGTDLPHGAVSHKVRSEIVFRVIFKGNPLASRAVLVHSPIGWDKELHTDSQGMASFTPLWPGVYVVEVEYQEKTSGEYKGKSFEAMRHRGTLTVDVLKDGRMENHHGTK
jgi:hypothetical protein